MLLISFMLPFFLSFSFSFFSLSRKVWIFRHSTKSMAIDIYGMLLFSTELYCQICLPSLDTSLRKKNLRYFILKRVNWQIGFGLVASLAQCPLPIGVICPNQVLFLCAHLSVQHCRTVTQISSLAKQPSWIWLNMAQTGAGDDQVIHFHDGHFVLRGIRTLNLDFFFELCPICSASAI